MEFEHVKYIPPVEAKAVCPKCGYIHNKMFPDAWQYIFHNVTNEKGEAAGLAEASKEIAGIVICPGCKARLLP